MEHIDNKADESSVNTDCQGHRKRLKERFDRSGLSGFADHEILELLLFYVIPRKDTKGISKDLLKTFGNLQGVFSAKHEHIVKIPGLGNEAARIIHLFRDLSQLILQRKIVQKAPVISEASDLIRYLIGTMSNLAEEQFRVVFVDHANAILKDEVLSLGIEDQTAVYPRQVMKRALALHATGIIVTHNHPTGNLSPSSADRKITQALIAAAATLDIRFLDHIIIGQEGKGYFSFREKGLLP